VIGMKAPSHLSSLHMPQGRIVTAWHPESAGVKVTFWRPWWKRKHVKFASTSEVLQSRRSAIDATR
jgi:hypothetical protein